MLQKAVYWAVMPPDRFGNQGVATPIEINCRWDDVNEEFMDIAGVRQVSAASVMVDRDLTLGSWLWLGLLADLPITTSAHPKTLQEAHKIKAFQRIPEVDPTNGTVRIAKL